LKNKNCVICEFPMMDYSSIWYDLDEENLHVQCSECFTLYDNELEIEMPGLIYRYGDA